MKRGARNGLEGFQLRGGVGVPDGGDNEVVRCRDYLADELESKSARCTINTVSCTGSSVWETYPVMSQVDMMFSGRLSSSVVELRWYPSPRYI